MTPYTKPQSSPRLRIFLSVVLLTAYGMAVAWVFQGESMAWPREGSMGSVVFFLLCPCIVYELFNLAYMLRTARRLTSRALTWVVAIPVGLFAAGFLANRASTLSMSGFEQAYAPFVTKVRTNLPDPCRAAGSYFQIPTVTAYNLQATPHRPQPAKLHHDSKRFVLAFQGGSIDIDGSTIYYDSGVAAWRKFHNDKIDDRKVYEELTAGLAECVLKPQ
mgnify:CR=1 FL=1